jgi:hypothetical protein
LFRDAKACSRGPRATCRVGWPGTAENSRSKPLPARTRLPSDRPLEGHGRASPAKGRRDRIVGIDGNQTHLFDSGRQEQKAGDVLGCQLNPNRCPEGIEAEDVQILVEVTQPR